MNNTMLSIIRMARIMDQILAGACTPVRFLFKKSTQKLYSRKPLQQNQQLGARVLHSFHAETVQIHTETVLLALGKQLLTHLDVEFHSI